MGEGVDGRRCGWEGGEVEGMASRIFDDDVYKQIYKS